MEKKEFEPQCKQASDVYREIARVLDMCNKAGIDTFNSWKNRVTFTGESVHDAVGCCVSMVEFAVGVVQGKPVFRGDTVYLVTDNTNGYHDKSIDGAKCEIYGLTAKGFLETTSEHGIVVAKDSGFSLTPPKQKTITITDAPIPAMATVATTEFDSGVVVLKFATAKDAQVFYDKVSVR